MNLYQIAKKNGFLSKNLIYNKTVLYLIFIIALTNLFLIFQQNDIFSIVFFFLIGFLTTFFSKNMIVILCICLFFTNVLKYGRSSAGHVSFEGFESTDENATDASGSSITPKKKKDMNPDTAKDESFESANTDKTTDVTENDVKNVENDPAIAQQEKLLDNMNKYKSLLDTLQGITQNMKEIKGITK